jgi:hypothetical protein
MVDAIVCCLLDFVSYFVQTKKFENCERFAVFSERKIEEGNAVAVVCFCCGVHFCSIVMAECVSSTIVGMRACDYIG